MKHQYVMQATFDLHEWPDCKKENDGTADITWYMKVFSSETLAIVKDTDKEDREKALKASWEANEPGRAEKAKKARAKFMLQERLRNGETLNEEEMALVKEVRERIRKKDEVVPDPKAAKAPPAKGAPAKGAPPAKADASKAPVAKQEEDEKAKRILPEPSQHVNLEIKSFLLHFKSDRLIHIACDNKPVEARKRGEEEKVQLIEQRTKERDVALKEIDIETQARENNKEVREKMKQEVFGGIEKERGEFKEKMSSIMSERNKYRDLIATRKEKDRAL